MSTSTIEHNQTITIPATAIDTLMRHWPEYLMEAFGLGLFMVSACTIGVVLEHPSSPIHALIPNDTLRRVLFGAAMGVTAILNIYSPWGQRSGAHLNPATTLTFWRLGQVAPGDATFYSLAQYVGGVAGVLISRLILISVVLRVSNIKSLSGYTGLFAGLLVMTFISIEAPISGMSMNPARTLGSAVPSGVWTSIWIYFTAPPMGMLLAAEVYLRLKGRHRVFCAKLHHHNTKRCIFRCNFDQMS